MNVRQKPWGGVFFFLVDVGCVFFFRRFGTHKLYNEKLNNFFFF